VKPKIVEEPPPPPSAPPPRRVVGLSMESTSEGGSGPAFATGNTNAGETQRLATDPRDIPRGPAPPVDTPPVEAPAANRAASNIPGLGGAIKPPVRRGEVKPKYPELLRAQGIEADVKLLIRVDAEGRVVDVKIVAASPYPELDASAVEAVRAGSYQPAVRDGVAVAYSLNFTVRFRLDQP
jgi:protein TonB